MTQGTAVSYRVFVRNWYRRERPDPYGRAKLVPDPGARKTTLATRCTEDEAQIMCHNYNAMHKPGPLSRKAEYERE
jgi:hypothetical protein